MFNIKISYLFVQIVFGKQKKVTIFALAINDFDCRSLEKWQSGRMRQS